MAKYTITHVCGHTSSATLYGKYADRESYIKWRSGQLCPDCYRKANPASPYVEVRKVKGGVEAIVFDGFDVRGVLKERGYRFGEFAERDNPLGVKFTPTGVRSAMRKGWALIISEPARLTAEHQWWAEQGWKVSLVDELTSTLQALGEGRPDLLTQV